MGKTVKIIVRNRFKEPKILMLPWGEDYGMLSDDEFEIIESQASDEFYFHIVFDEYISVYAEGQSDCYPRVFKECRELNCGHNLR